MQVQKQKTVTVCDRCEGEKINGMYTKCDCCGKEVCDNCESEDTHYAWGKFYNRHVCKDCAENKLVDKLLDEYAEKYNETELEFKKELNGLSKIIKVKK